MMNRAETTFTIQQIVFRLSLACKNKTACFQRDRDTAKFAEMKT